ncbi:MAG: cupin domain-containing protein [Gemmatimonadota bacterium]
MSLRDQFAERGFVGPIAILSAQESQRFLRESRKAQRPLDWEKGHAAGSRRYYEIGTHPAITKVVAPLLGGDVILWGASIVRRTPGAVHAWHSDIESCAPLGKTVSVWLGLENTTRDSSLQLIPRTHLFGKTVQEVRQQKGEDAATATADIVLGWALETDERCELITPDMTDGEAVFFDGRLWHGSHNLLDRTRKALLLQYATPDTPIHIPDLNYLDWPFHKIEQPRPACILVRGEDGSGANRVVPGPVSEARGFGPVLGSRAYSLQLPLSVDDESAWKPHYIFSGGTADLNGLSCHASSLAPGASPHPPHGHADEELLLMLAGEADLSLPDAAAGQQTTRLHAGQFVYYPANFPHTLTATGDQPANYLMFKWQGTRAGAGRQLGYAMHEMAAGEAGEAAGGEAGVETEDCFRTIPVFEGRTSWLRKLHCHASTLTPGGGYDPHIDAYDVALVVLEGEVETLGVRVGPPGVIFYRAGEPHGIHNPGDKPASYLVFEFHGAQGVPGYAPTGPRRTLRSKLTDPQAWKRKGKRILRSLRSAH